MLSQELRQFGLSEKESSVYLAALELGASAVQKIAQKAGINRATTYVILESLIEKGLCSHFTKGKKRFFTAEAPEQILGLLKSQERALEDKRKKFEKFLPELKAIYNLAEEKPKVRFFEGIEGLRTIQEDVLVSKSEFLKEITDLDRRDDIISFLKSHRPKLKEKFKNIPTKTIYTTAKGEILSSKEGKKERIFVKSEKFPYPAEIIIYGRNKIALIVVEKKIGVIIENKEIYQSINSLFDLAWLSSKK